MAGYKTYIAAALVAIFGILAQTDWITFLNNPSAGLVALGSALLFAVLRAITHTPPAVQIVLNKNPGEMANAKTETMDTKSETSDKKVS